MLAWMRRADTSRLRCSVQVGEAAERSVAGNWIAGLRGGPLPYAMDEARALMKRFGHAAGVADDQALVERFPGLKVVLEHVSTREAVEFVLSAGDRVAATITPQHLMYNRNDMLVGGVRPHYYCLPILKRDTHQQALRDAVAGGSCKFSVRNFQAN